MLEQYANPSSILNDLYNQSIYSGPSNTQYRLNADWARDSFFTPREHMTRAGRQWTFISSADHKYVDSSFGGNYTVNPRPQWTPLADPRRMGTLVGRKSMLVATGANAADPILNVSDLGLGRLYSEQYDDNQQRIYFRFGVPMYNSITSFLAKMTDTETVQIATTGSSRWLSRIIGALSAYSFLAATKPITAIFLVIANITIKFIGNRIYDGSQFYALKPRQHDYWAGVQSMVSEYLTASGIVEYDGVLTRWSDKIMDLLTDTGLIDLSRKDKYSTRQEVDPDAKKLNLSNLHEIIPELFDEHRAIDIINIYGKTRRRTFQYLERQNEMLYGTDGSIRSYFETVSEAIKRRARGLPEASNIDWGVTTDNVPPKKVLDKVSKILDNQPVNGTAYTGFLLAATAADCILYNKAELFSVIGSGIAAVGEAIVDGANSATGGLVSDVGKKIFADAPSENVPQQQESIDIATESFFSKDPRYNAPPVPTSQPQSNADKVRDVYAGNALKQERDEGGVSSMYSFFNDELGFGAEMVGFDVNYAGPVQEGFTNNVTPSPLAEMLNGLSASSRSIRYMSANGNISSNMLVQGVQSIVGAAMNVVGGVLDTFTVGISSGIFDLIRGAHIDIPQFWDSSVVNLPTASYTIPLRSVAGDPLSALKNIYIPLFCIIEGCAPQSVGGSSHVHPFYCEIFDKGRLQKNCAMITSATITRGVGNLGYDPNWQGLAIDVTIEVTDLAPMLTIPTMSGMIDSNDPIALYIATLAACDIENQVHGRTKIAKEMQRYGINFDRYVSSTWWGSRIAQWVKGSSLRWVVIPAQAFGLGNQNSINGLPGSD